MFSSQTPQRRTDGTMEASNHHEEYELLLDTGSNQRVRFHQKRNYPSVYSFLPLFLPTSCRGRRFLPSPKRALGTLCLIPIVLCMLVIVYGGIPPSFRSIKAYEHSLPQHDWSKGIGSKLSGAYEERYLSFPDHIWGHGFNNILQDMYVGLVLHIEYLIRKTFTASLLHTSLMLRIVHSSLTITFGLTFLFPTRCTIFPCVQRAFHSMPS